MVQSHQHHVLAGRTSVELDPEHRATLEIERPLRLRRHGPTKVLLAPRARVDEVERDPFVRPDTLHRRAVATSVGGAEDGVTLDERLPAAAHRVDVQRRRDAQRAGEVVGRAGRVELVEEPERGLSEREGRLARRGRGGRGQGQRAGRGQGLEHRLHHVGEPGVLHERGDAEEDAEVPLEVVRELDGGDRVDAERRDRAVEGHLARRDAKPRRRCAPADTGRRPRHGSPRTGPAGRVGSAVRRRSLPRMGPGRCGPPPPAFPGRTRHGTRSAGSCRSRSSGCCPPGGVRRRGR